MTDLSITGGVDCFRHYGSLLDALSKGAKQGLTLVGFVVINILVFLALLEFLEQTLLWFTERAGVEGFGFTVRPFNTSPSLL